MNNPIDQSIVPAWGVLGLLGMITLEGVNTFIAILVGLATLFYLSIKIVKELKKR